MKELVFAGLLTIAGPVAFTTPTPVFASEQNDQVALCAAALDAQGVAPADAYRAKFLKSKGAAVKTVTVKLIPTGDGESMTAVCQIKRGEVLEASITA